MSLPAPAPTTPKEQWTSDPVCLLQPPALFLQGTGLQWEGHYMDCTLLGQPFLCPCSFSGLWSDLWAQHPLQPVVTMVW